MSNREVISTFLFGYFFGVVSNDLYNYIKTYVSKNLEVVESIYDDDDKPLADIVKDIFDSEPKYYRPGQYN